MAQVHADPDKLRQFAAELRRAGSDLEGQASSLLKRLGNIDWDDSERRQFEQDISTVTKAIAQFSRRLRDEYAPRLERKARALDEFRR